VVISDEFLSLMRKGIRVEESQRGFVGVVYLVGQVDGFVRIDVTEKTNLLTRLRYRYITVQF